MINVILLFQTKTEIKDKIKLKEYKTTYLYTKYETCGMRVTIGVIKSKGPSEIFSPLQKELLYILLLMTSLPPK